LIDQQLNVFANKKKQAETFEQIVGREVVGKYNKDFGKSPASIINPEGHQFMKVKDISGRDVTDQFSFCTSSDDKSSGCAGKYFQN